MNLLPCKICGGKVDWWACSDEGCHLIVCKKCKATFDLGNSTPTDHIDTLEELREQIAEVWNRRASPEPLTDEQIFQIAHEAKNVKRGMLLPVTFARLIENAHGIGGDKCI